MLPPELNNAGLTKHSILLPAAFLTTPLIDSDGVEWRVRARTVRRMGLFSKRILVAEKADRFPEESLRIILRKLAMQVLKNWTEQDALPQLQLLARETNPLFKECVAEGERVFRKEFITKLGSQGQAMWRQILTEQFDEIGKFWIQEKPKGPATIFSTGPLPPGTRFRWQLKSSAANYEIFCLEAPPQKRTIRIFRSTHRLAFPWMYFLVAFRNDNFLMSWVFYRSAPLENEADRVSFPNLPHIRGGEPFDWCLGSGMPTIHLSNRLWPEVLIGWFWNSEFLYESGTFAAWWQDAANRIPEVATVEAWEKLSRENPEKMLALPWKKLDQPLGEFVKKFLKGQVRNEAAPGNSVLQEREVVKERLIARFRERLEEELHFLGAHFAVPVELEGSANLFIKQRFESVLREIQRKLEERCIGTPDSAVKTYIKKGKI